jgi:hypothetical protein
MSWLLLVLLAFAFWLTMKIANACAKRESWVWPLLGVVASLGIGGIFILIGERFAIGDIMEVREYRIVTYPVLGWISMIGGGIMTLAGIWKALSGATEKVELREMEENLEEEEEHHQQKWAKEEAMKMLEQGEIDDYERLDLILGILSDMHEFNLSYELEDLRNKLTKEQRK